MPIEESIPYDRIKPIEQGLMEMLPDPPMFHTRDQIDNLTYEKALEVIRAARRMLLMTLLTQEHHEHMLDDCGDDLAAATDNWATLHRAYFANDGDPDHVRNDVQKWLLDADNQGLGGSDGEIRFVILSERVLEEVYDF